MEEKILEIESTVPGRANGISLQLYKSIQKGEAGLTPQEKEEIIKKAATAFGQFLTALGVDWQNDPNSKNTPYRVAKAYVEDLWRGRYELPPQVTSFPSEGYDGMVFEGNIPLTSMCSHHHQTITGKVHVAYIPSSKGNVIGLSKINRIVEHYGRRGAIQEQLTVAIHKAIDRLIKDNKGVAVYIEAEHNCVICRGVKHEGSSMKTAVLSGAFFERDSTKAEFYSFVRGYKINS